MRRNSSKASTSSKSVVKPEPSGGAVATYDYGDAGNEGFEGVGADDIIIPAMVLLQGLSPQVAKKVGQGGVEGAKPGMIMNGITEQLYGDEGFGFIPVMTDTDFVRWRPREKGGGIVARFRPEDEFVADTRKLNGTSFGKLLVDPKQDAKETDSLVETKYLYGHLITEDGGLGSLVVVRFTSTKIGGYKKFLTAYGDFRRNKKINAPLYGVQLRVKPLETKNEKGEFFVFDLAPISGTGEQGYLDSLIPPGDERLDALRATYEKIAAQRDKIQIVGDDAGGSDAGAEKEVPF